MNYVCELKGFNILVAPSEAPAFVFVNISKLKWIRRIFNFFFSNIGFTYVVEIKGERFRLSSNGFTYKLSNDLKKLKIATIERSLRFKVKLASKEKIDFKAIGSRDVEINYRDNRVGLIRNSGSIIPSKCELHTDESNSDLLITMIAVAVLTVAT